MTDEEIFDIAELYGWMDDFGRWNFKETGLIKFALALMKSKQETMKQALDAITNVLAGGDFDNPYADLKQAGSALKQAIEEAEKPN
jgi:hypothetical protein